ncbi:MAG: hypothetical protein Q8Q53_00830 [Novosphingobium sp.]|nr:hypothetical protein [Novosphingobium sp.]
MANVVVVTGGASVGERDYARAMFAEQELEPLFTKVAIKPAKPIWIGCSHGLAGFSESGLAAYGGLPKELGCLLPAPQSRIYDA